jgi:hypothetical protein
LSTRPPRANRRRRWRRSAPACPASGALATEALVEVPAIAKIGERIGVGKPTRFRVQARVLQGGPERSRQPLEVGELLLDDGPLGPPPEDCEAPDANAVLAHQRDSEPARQPERVVDRLLLRVEILQLHGAGTLRLGRNSEQVPRGLLRRKPVAGRDGIAFVLAQDDQRRVGLGELAHGPKSALQSLVEVERGPQLAQRCETARLLTRVGQRAGQLGEELLGPFARPFELRDLVRGSPTPADEQHDADREQQRRQRRSANACPSRPRVE